jgi:hypothetical protein
MLTFIVLSTLVLALGGTAGWIAGWTATVSEESLEARVALFAGVGGITIPAIFFFAMGEEMRRRGMTV